MVVQDASLQPLPVCPPLQPGEAFTSWTARIAHHQELPLGLLLARLTVATTERFNDMPSTYGLSLTTQQLRAVSAITGVRAREVAASLLTTYADGPVDLGELHPSDTTQRIGYITRYEWLHLARTLYCPDCIRVSGGVRQLDWRLPWSYACLTHRAVLLSHCPGCNQPAGRPRGDRSARPGHITLVPRPELCGNALPAREEYAIRPGRAARPCEQDLTDALAPLVPNENEGMIATQARLIRLIENRGARETWQDLRAITTALLYLTDTDDLARLAPHLIDEALRIPAVETALAQRDIRNAEHARERGLIRQGGGDRSAGRRQREVFVPGDPALMAAIVPVAVHLYGSLPTDHHTHGDAATADASMASLVALARMRRKSLAPILRDLHATPPLVERVDAIARQSGKFAHALPIRTATNFGPTNVPAYLWPEHSAPFISCMPGTREDTARMFASMHLVKTITGDTWAEAAIRLGLPGKANIVAALVSRITVAGTRQKFLNATDNLVRELDSGSIPIVDYSERRHLLRGLDTIPSAVLKGCAPQLPATTARRKNAAAWLWATLTGGHPWDAPAWGREVATQNQREVYRRFCRFTLPQLQDALLEYGLVLIGE